MYKFDTSIIFPDDPTATPQRIEIYRKIYAEKYNIITTKCADISSILEIGVRAGYSAYTFLQAYPNGTYIGLDANNGLHGGVGGEDGKYMRWAHKILSPYNAKLIHMDTQRVDILDLGMEFDFIYIDGDHTMSGVMHDLDICLPVLKRINTSRILLDDYVYIKTVKKGIDTWLMANSDKVYYEVIDTVRGDVLIWLK